MGQPDRRGTRTIANLRGAPTIFTTRKPRVVRDTAQMGALLHGMLLTMEVLPVLNVIDLGDELFLDRIAGVEAVKGLPHHELQVVVGFLDLADVDPLQL